MATKDLHTNPDQRRKYVLVVNDEIAILALITKILEPSGFTVATALDGNSALEMIDHTRPDLIITDDMMPGLHGFELVAAIRELDHISNIPILVLSVNNDVDYLRAGLEAGANRYLVIPCAPSDLTTIVKEMLEEGN